MDVNAPAQIITAPVNLYIYCTSTAHLIPDPAQTPATVVAVYTALLDYVSEYHLEKPLG